MVLPGEQVVDLQQVEAFDAPQLARILDLTWTVFTGRGPDFGRRKQTSTASAEPYIGDESIIPPP